MSRCVAQVWVPLCGAPPMLIGGTSAPHLVAWTDGDTPEHARERLRQQCELLAMTASDPYHAFLWFGAVGVLS